MKKKTIEMAEMQKGIYFDCQMEQTSSYHVSASVLLENADEQCLTNALKVLVHEQESLRSAFEIEDGLPVMHIYDKADYEFRKIDLSEEKDQNLKVVEITKEIIGTPFVLSKVSLFRAALLKTASNQHILILCCHHLVSDGVSMGILVDKLLHYHHCFFSGTEIEVTTDSGFSGFIDKENHKLAFGEYQESKRFWKTKLDGAEALTFQTDYTCKTSGLETGRERRSRSIIAFYL